MAYSELGEDKAKHDFDNNERIFSKKEDIKISVIKKKCSIIKTVAKLMKTLAQNLEKIVELTLSRIDIEFELRSGQNFIRKKVDDLFTKEKKKSFSNENKMYKKKNLEIIDEGNYSIKIIKKSKNRK